MRYRKVYAFPKDILGLRLGWSLAGPPLMTVHCFFMERDMVDTGLAHMGPEVLEMAREHKVQRIFLTHHHEDHSGNAALIREKTGATVFGHPLTRAKMKTRYPILPYQKYVWGRTTPVDVAPLPETVHTVLGPMQAVHTPGHSRDHLSFFLPDAGILFSGDLYIGDRIKFFRSDEDIASEIASLKKVLTLDFDTLLCSHNPRTRGGRGHLRAKLNFLEDFFGRIAALHGQGLSERQIFSRLKLREDLLIKWFCFNNVSMINGVRSVVKSCRVPS